jgi:hypothetical protein
MKSALRLAIAVLLSTCLFSPAALAELVTIQFEVPGGTFDPNDPGGGVHGPYDWLEAGARYSGFWFTSVGTPAGSSQRGHTHLGGTPWGGNVGDGPHSWNGALQGGRLSLENGGRFDLISIDYRIESRDVPPDAGEWVILSQRLPWSYPVDNVHLVISEDIDPVAPDFPTFESQFSGFDIDDGSQFDLGGGNFDPLRPAASLMLQTLVVTGFDDVEAVNISHSGATVYIDNIVIDTLPLNESAVPAPGPLLVPGLVLVGAIGASRIRRRT